MVDLLAPTKPLPKISWLKVAVALVAVILVVVLASTLIVHSNSATHRPVSNAYKYGYQSGVNTFNSGMCSAFGCGTNDTYACQYVWQSNTAGMTVPGGAFRSDWLQGCRDGMASAEHAFNHPGQ